MGWPNNRLPAAPKSHADCSGCSLCLLVCPVWHKQRDIRLTPHGRAKALQHGASVADIADSIESCTLCGACDPVCPENINLLDMTLDLRRELMKQKGLHTAQTFYQAAAQAQVAATRLLLPDHALRQDGRRLVRITTLLGGPGRIEVATDDGADLSLALELGTEIPAQRLEGFLAPLRRLKEIVVTDGLLLRQMLRWLPGAKIVSLGEALSRLEPVRRNLRATDLYVIETRAFHADYRRMVSHYERLRRECDCAINLDLQRIAIPATARALPQLLGQRAADDRAQARWLLKGRKVKRIVVESLEDRLALEEIVMASQAAETSSASGIPVVPVVHLADLIEYANLEKQGGRR